MGSLREGARCCSPQVSSHARVSGQAQGALQRGLGILCMAGPAFQVGPGHSIGLTGCDLAVGHGTQVHQPAGDIFRFSPSDGMTGGRPGAAEKSPPAEHTDRRPLTAAPSRRKCFGGALKGWLIRAGTSLVDGAAQTAEGSVRLRRSAPVVVPRNTASVPTVQVPRRGWAAA